MPSLKKNKMDEYALVRWQEDIVEYKQLWKSEMNNLLSHRTKIIKVMMDTEFNYNCLCPVPF